jgi:thiol-disulfide isomerase/thioredoxin
MPAADATISAWVTVAILAGGAAFLFAGFVQRKRRRLPYPACERIAVSARCVSARHYWLRSSPWAVGTLSCALRPIAARRTGRSRKQRGLAAPARAGPEPKGGPGVPLDARGRDSRAVAGFHAANREGKPTSIAAWRGKSLVLNFWATWCAPCRREIPLLEALDAQWNARNVAVVGIAVDHRDEVLEFAEQFQIAYPLADRRAGRSGCRAAMGVASPVFPFTVFTDRRGEVVAVFVGELHRPQADLILGEVKRPQRRPNRSCRRPAGRSPRARPRWAGKAG